MKKEEAIRRLNNKFSVVTKEQYLKMKEEIKKLNKIKKKSQDQKIRLGFLLAFKNGYEEDEKLRKIANKH